VRILHNAGGNTGADGGTDRLLQGIPGVQDHRHGSPVVDTAYRAPDAFVDPPGNQHDGICSYARQGGIHLGIVQLGLQFATGGLRRPDGI
jgi:hypothetical protein